MIKLSKENFEQEVLKAESLVMVDFWSQKCEPCKALMPGIHQLVERNTGRAKFCSLDTTNNKRLAISQKVLGLPTVVFYKKGEKVGELVQKFSLEDVQKKLDQLA